MSKKLPIDGLTEEEREKERLMRWNKHIHALNNLKSEYIWHMKQRDDLLDAVINQKEYISKIETENAKLRELVSVIYEDECDECDRWRYRDLIRDLGIEVVE